ncbi:hypothetical protein EVG20_g10478 [Dentipellis fragilis]|uniref:Uncharacterized protein n=1 Tax=Dentipellis fragilis TaxID=205917 RepID=A0A4Y9XTB8_9AGAM|nr:hypothetical protein EVG20_g10478 [Dentipellis fragilis]
MLAFRYSRGPAAVVASLQLQILRLGARDAQTAGRGLARAHSESHLAMMRWNVGMLELESWKAGIPGGKWQEPAGRCSQTRVAAACCCGPPLPLLATRCLGESVSDVRRLRNANEGSIDGNLEGRAKGEGHRGSLPGSIAGQRQTRCLRAPRAQTEAPHLPEQDHFNHRGSYDCTAVLYSNIKAHFLVDDF